MLKKPIRVLYIIGGGEFGGAEQHVLNLIKGLEATECDVQVACFYDALFAQRVRAAGVSVAILGQGGFLSAFQNLREVIHNFHPNLIHTHGVRANVVGRMTGSLLRIAVITTIHSNFALDYPNRLKRTILYTLERITRPLVHTYIAVSQAIQKELVDEGVSPSKIDVIYNGIDTNYFVPRINGSGTHTGSGLPTVVTVARLHPVKGHKSLLEAIERVQTPANFVFVGDGELRSELEHIIQERDLPVVLVGHQNSILSFYQKADLVVQPSISEGFSLSVAEALACGVPVIATRAGGVVEIVQHMKQGVELTEVGDAKGLAAAIDNMLQHPQKPDREAIIRLFSLQQMCKGTLKLYRKVTE